MKHKSKEYWANLIQRNSVIGDEIVKYRNIRVKGYPIDRVSDPFIHDQREFNRISKRHPIRLMVFLLQAGIIFILGATALVSILFFLSM